MLDDPVNFIDPSGELAPLVLIGVGLTLVGVGLLATASAPLPPSETPSPQAALIGYGFLLGGGAMTLFPQFAPLVGQICSAVCTDGDCTNEAKSATRLIPELGRKLDFVLGKATGSQHNINRSRAMLAQLQRIGLSDTPAARQYLAEHFTRVLNDPNNIARIQENGRVVRESLLMGPLGGLKTQSIWEGNKLITIILFGGGK